ncbi:MAG: YifB family Mg chelatase-like AAA ATPase [Kiritimatiellae bacterium]|nr:YifB family Mg chelatase-like AAA ATPase [Kiritimatiellia bacterium]
MLARCYSGSINGVEASTIEIEVYAAKSTSSFAIVGLPDTAVKEAKDRVSTALKNSGYRSKDEYSVTVNLAPADVRKEGPIYDLPIAVCLLKATQRLRTESLDDYALVGELSLSGRVRRVRGILPIVMEMKRIGKRAIIVPEENVDEASVVEGIDVVPVKTLREAAQYLSGETFIEPRFTDLADLVAKDRDSGDDFADVKGQQTAKRALEIAVSGGHNVLMIGSPGSGKTMLARRVPSILPPMSVEEALEVSRIHSVAGREKGGGMFVTTRPFRAPHHTVSSIGLLGGGTHPVPGEVSLAHRGVLFLDEFAEFPRAALEVLRQPLEDGHVGVSRAAAACDFPSRFMLIAAMNPCPCGYSMDPSHECSCNPAQVKKYQHRISGPLLDRIDIQVAVRAVPPKDLDGLANGEPSAAIRARVVAAREIQRRRYAGVHGVVVNADVPSRDLRDVCRLSSVAAQRMRECLERLNMSARAYDRVLRVSRTIADLAGKEDVDDECVLEAATCRELDKESGTGEIWT